MSTSKLKRVRITSDGRLTKVFLAETGEEFPMVQHIKFEQRVHGRPLVFIEQIFQLDSFDIVADAPYGAQTLDEAKAEDAEFRRQVQEAINDPRPSVPHDQVMSEMREIIVSKKSGAKGNAAPREFWDLVKELATLVSTT